jgi:hypothetical protein
MSTNSTCKQSSPQCSKSHSSSPVSIIAPHPSRRNPDNRRFKVFEGSARHASLFSTTLNLANTAIGMGTLCMPYTFQQTGILTGVVFTLIAAGLTGISLHFLKKIGEVTQKERFCGELGHYMF